MEFTAEAEKQLADDGFVLVGDVLDPQAVEELRRVARTIANGHEHNGRMYAARNLLTVPEIAQWARSQTILDLVTPALGERASPVRGLLFNKLAEANWAVPWHQDLTIAVRERRAAPGFGPWSVKDGIVHVQPPDEVIARMMSVRIHLDDTDAANGALRVIPGSHKEGRLSAEAIGRWTTTREAITIDAPSGSVLLMRPHLLHASSAAESPGQRRVIHIEYAGDELAFGLEWNEACLTVRARER